jgi:RHS repeat-associated protein
VVEYYHTDALGSVRAVTKVVNGQVQVVSRHDYKPFGEEVSPQTPPVDKRLFTGKERDQETGWDYFEARYLATGLARFSTVDPLGASGRTSDPQSWNRYTYGRSNPLRFVDPSGLDWSDLSAEQRRVFQSYRDNYNTANKTSSSPEEVYGTLSASQMATFESVTYALEHTQLIGANGSNAGNALQHVSGVTRIAGEIPGSSKGDEQFRVFADLRPGAVEAFAAAQGFEPSSNSVLGLFQIYHQGYPESFRQVRREGVAGMEAGLQPSYSRTTLRADIDVDYRFGAAHLQPANSDVRGPGNYQKFIDRWPGLRDWWKK